MRRQLPGCGAGDASDRRADVELSQRRDRKPRWDRGRGLDVSSWSLSAEAEGGLKVEATSGPDEKAESSAGFAATDGAREYKVLTPRDKFFEGKFDLTRLEAALNHYGRQGWTVKSMSTPHVKGFTGALEETIVVLLER